jgi:hypothetical protein
VSRFAQFLLQLLFGLMMVVGVGVMLVGVIVEHSTGMTLVGGFTALMGLFGYNWLGE